MNVTLGQNSAGLPRSVLQVCRASDRPTSTRPLSVVPRYWHPHRLISTRHRKPGHYSIHLLHPGPRPSSIHGGLAVRFLVIPSLTLITLRKSHSKQKIPTDLIHAEAYTALMDNMQPPIFIVHSQAGPYGWPARNARPDLAKAVVNIELTGLLEGLPPFGERQRT